MRKGNVFSIFKEDKYENLFPEIKILGEQVHLFLPCYVYECTVMVAESKVNPLNLFEEALLKLLEYQPYSKEQLADILCLHPDFVNFILIRLKELRFLNERNFLTDVGIKQLNLYKQENQELKEEVIKVFRNKGDGQLLPCLYKGEWNTSPLQKEGEHLMKAEIGSAGRRIARSGFLLDRPYHDTTEPPQVTKREILRLTKAYNNLCEGSKHFKRLKIREDYFIPTTFFSESVLHLQAVVQDGNVEQILVSEGFLPNIDFLSEYVEKYFPDVVISMKKEATFHTIQDSKKTHYVPVKYPEIHIKKPTPEKEQDDSKDGKELVLQKIPMKIVNAYAGIEWALHYHLKENPLSQEYLHLLESQSQEENELLLQEYANKIGMNVSEKNIHLFSNLNSEKISAYYYQRSIPHLYTVLPLCICQTFYDSSSPFHKLIKKMPLCLDFLSELHKKASDARHKMSTNITEEVYSVLEYKTWLFVTTLLSDFQERQEVRTEHDIYFSASQLKLNGEYSLKKELNSVFIQSLSKEMQSKFVQISSDKKDYQLPEHMEYIMILCTMLEQCFMELIEDCQEICTVLETKANTIKVVEEKIEVTLPKSLKSVQDNFIKQAYLGKDCTLGAYTLVALYLVDSDKLKELLRCDLINLVDFLCNARLHGNKIGLEVDYSILKKWRGKVIDILKVTGG